MMRDNLSKLRRFLNLKTNSIIYQFEGFLYKNIVKYEIVITCILETHQSEAKRIDDTCKFNDTEF